MGWSYTANPGGVPADLVRLLLGDTDAISPLCDDAEVSFALSDHAGNAYLAAAWLAERVAAKLSRDETISAAGVSISPMRTAERFKELAVSLRREAAEKVTLPAAGSGNVARYGLAVVTGVSISDMAAADANSDRIKPSFTREDPSQDAAGSWL